MILLRDFKRALMHLAFPHVCTGCGSDCLEADIYLCLRCQLLLPETHFHLHADNSMEKAFWGRVPIVAATAQYYFSNKSLMQHLLHEFKYRKHVKLGFYLGQLMGYALLESGRFNSIDSIVPLPLHPKKQSRRGFNQAEILSNGIAGILEKPVLTEAVMRTTDVESQTRKSRIERWQNMDGIFKLKDDSLIKEQHVLLVDDVMTTGATLEACSGILLDSSCTISMACLCYTSS